MIFLLHRSWDTQFPTHWRLRPRRPRVSLTVLPACSRLSRFEDSTILDPRPRQSDILVPWKVAKFLMALILASTRSAFFQHYDFQNPHATLYTELHRLAKYRKWKQGSNSKIFEKAWNHYFGPEVPVGCNIDRRESRTGAQHGTDDGEFFSLLCSLQGFDLGGGIIKRKGRIQRVGPEFASHYGSDACITEKWQALCQDCGVNPVPPSINQCKNVQLLPAVRSTGISSVIPGLTSPSIPLGTERRIH